MIHPFSSNIDNLTGQAQGIAYSSSALMASLHDKEISIPTVERSHLQIMQVYERTMNEISSLKEKINAVTDRSNEEEMFYAVTQVAEIESQIENARIQLNDTVLTYCPTAKIAYGPSCVGPKKAPDLDRDDSIIRDDRRIQDMLSRCSCIREIRGDGNCFVSAFATRFLEDLIEQNAVEGFIGFIMEDGINDEPQLKEEILGTLFQLQEYPSQKDTILENNHKMLPLIKYFRLLAADEMLKNQETFEQGFRYGGQYIFDGDQEGKSYRNLISEHVLAMGVDFSHPPIIALCQRLKFNVMVIDTKFGSEEGLTILEGHPVQGTFCRKSAHYFVLYTKEEAAPMLPQSIAPAHRSPAPSPTSDLITNCKVPFGHALFIRTEMDNWQRGVPLTQVDEEHWIYSSSTPLNNTAYKFLIDDTFWENGENRKITQGRVDERSPQFDLPSNLEIQDAPMPPVQTTRITVKYDAGLGNSLFIRGEPPLLNWEKGIALKNTGSDTWVFETEGNFPSLKYKIVLNDNRFEQGEDHKTDCGKKEEISPRF